MPDKRPPQKTPGAAHLDEPKAPDDFTLPAALFADAIHFLEKAQQYSEQKHWTGESAYLRAALAASFNSLEASLNQTAFGHAEAHAEKLGTIELDVLMEQETVMDERGHIVRRTRYYPLEARISFLAMFLSGKQLDRNTEVWRRFITAKRLRDTWTHPKPPFNTGGLTHTAVEEAVYAVRNILIEFSRLMEIEPVQWLIDLSEALDAVQRPADDPPCI
jgi:hypothetical protein